MSDDEFLRMLEEEIKKIRELQAKIEEEERKKMERIKKGEEMIVKPKPKSKQKPTTKPAETKVVNTEKIEWEGVVPVVGEPPELEGIPEENPEVDRSLFYLRVQALTGAEKHDLIESEIDKLRGILPEKTIEWIESQFEKPAGERELIPLTKKTDRFLIRLYNEIYQMILDRYQGIPEDKAAMLAQDVIERAIYSAQDVSNEYAVEAAAKGIVRNPRALMKRMRYI